MTLASYRLRLMSLIVVSLLALMVWFAPQSFPFQKAKSLFEIHFLNVGQGDAILVESPDGAQLLVDGGRDGLILSALAPKLGYFDRTIDVVIATHPDSDHIGGLVDVLARYQVSTVIMTENEKDTPAAQDFMKAVEAEGATIIFARAGAQYMLGASTTIHILFPDRDPSGFESNAASIVTKVMYGATDVILTGDSPRSIEEYVVRQYGPYLQSEILKLGHHGSDTSSSEAFLDAVRPQYAIVSAGRDNSYGHPHKEVVERVEERSIPLLKTEDGTITFLSDGTSLWQQ